ncbi:MAG TPA: recombinase family protein [Tardiphaga sp.]
MATILYARVSTLEQNVEHQQTQAEAAGFKIDQVVADHGVSGVTTLFADRPNGKRLFDLLRRGDTLLVRWVDRLGRNYSDVRDTIQQFMRRGVVVRTVINNLTFDGATTDPMQQAVRDALIGFLAATAQANAEAIKEAQRGGIALARAKEGDIKYRGRKPTFNHRQLTTVRDMDGQGVGEIAKATGLSRQTVYRIKADPAAAEAVLASWAG